MALTSLPRRPRSIGRRRTIGIVASLYNEEYVNALIENCNQELVRLMPSSSIPLYRVPGAFEIPVCVDYVIRNTKLDAIIALGLVIRGQTNHGDVVANSVTDTLQRLSTENGIPIIHGVLLVDNEEQARVRCIEEEFNRGIEAARAAINMAELFSKLRNVHESKVKAGG